MGAVTAVNGLLSYFEKNSSYVSGVSVCIFVALYLCNFVSLFVRMFVARAKQGWQQTGLIPRIPSRMNHERGQSPTLSRASCVTVHLMQIGFSQ